MSSEKNRLNKLKPKGSRVIVDNDDDELFPVLTLEREEIKTSSPPHDSSYQAPTEADQIDQIFGKPETLAKQTAWQETKIDTPRRIRAPWGSARDSVAEPKTGDKFSVASEAFLGISA